MPVKLDSIGRRRRRYQKRYHPMIVYRKKEFLARYRLTKRVVRHLSKRFSAYSSTKGKKNGGGLDHEARFCLALRFFSTGGIYSLCGDSLHVSKALVSRAIRDVSDYFYHHAHKYIHWPNLFEQKMEKATEFLQEHQKPRVVGCIDGTHIAILRPQKNESSFVNRKNWHSINTTIVCDAYRRIIYADSRWAGSAADAYTYTASAMGDQCVSGKMGDFLLLGDSGYPLHRNLFIPYTNPSAGKQAKFNEWHKSTRATVEQTIGILKQRFRCLDSSCGYLYHTPYRAAKIIIACCCLHNVAMERGIPVEEHVKDPWAPKRKPLPQPKQRRQREAIKKYRDDYAEKHF